MFYVVVLSPWPIYTHPNQIRGYAPDQLQETRVQKGSFRRLSGYGYEVR